VDAEPSHQQYRRYLLVGLRRRGIVLQKCGRPAEAILAFRNAIDVLEGIAKPRPGDLYDIACCQSLLAGAALEVGSGLTVAAGQAEADKAMDRLRRAIS